MADDIPLVIFNAPYDLTVLDRETRRYDLEPFGDILGRWLARGLCGVVDPFVLDKHVDRYRKGKRTLEAACGHYKVTLDGAHQSSADAIAAMRVAWRIASRYPVIAGMELPELHELQTGAKAEQAASFQEYLRRQGNDEVVDTSWPLKPLALEAVTS
jgi:DNA polymerase-3 subunit epsilon